MRNIIGGFEQVPPGEAAAGIVGGLERPDEIGRDKVPSRDSGEIAVRSATAFHIPYSGYEVPIGHARKPEPNSDYIRLKAQGS